MKIAAMIDDIMRIRSTVLGLADIIVTECCWLAHGTVAHPMVSAMNVVAAALEFVEATKWADACFTAAAMLHDMTIPVGSKPRNVDH